LVYMRHGIRHFYGACMPHVPQNWKNSMALPMRHRINLVEHTFSDTPQNVCLWIASLLVVMVLNKYMELTTRTPLVQ
jgi:hypothetical protein